MPVVRTSTITPPAAQLGAPTLVNTGMGGPFLLMSDLTTLIGNVNANKHRLAVSADSGTSWTQGSLFIDSTWSINGVMETLDNEILVSLKAPSGGTGLVFKSVGWNKATARGATKVVSNKLLVSNVVTLTTSTPHGYAVGDYAYISGIDSTFNGSVVVTAVPSATTFQYAKVAADVASSSAAGVVDIWKKVITCSGADNWCDGRWGFTQRSVAPSWSKRAGQIMVCEYGKHVDVAATPDAAAIRAWLSKDNGLTWAVVFNLRDRYPGLTAKLHNHGCSYDPYDDRWLIVQGDGGQGDGGMCGIWWCNGETIDAPTWTLIPGSQTTTSLWQTTTVIPMETGLVLLGDGGPYGVNRVARRGYRRYGILQAVAPIGNAIIGGVGWRNNGWDPGAPLLLSYVASTASGPPSLVATVDGEVFTEIARDTVVVTNGAPGYVYPLGPDIFGKVVWNLNLNGSGQLAVAEYLAP
ncbi:hypothetical protein [Rhodococcoides fascians]|uniref:hypothetical protein n=1 Tax=Rhodococcoides fascians TaxID=1828 RepID=UPI0024BA4638|nr:hypothetical protein [Rhodococcus fascians]MDJ0467286.1 hypothetical protein [Rhodococcus fascians]